jgi:hypothetical protein
MRLLVVLVALLFSRLTVAQTIHTEAAEAYWQLTDALRRDEPLSEAAWHAFLALPDNATYISSIYSAQDLQAYRRALEVTYMPRYDSLRQVKLKTGGWFYRLLNDYKQREPIYKAFLAETARNPAYLATMYTYANEFLPTRDRKQVRDLRLVYVALGDDAISARSGLVFSLWNAYNYQQLRPGILEAHELHHQLRTQKEFGAIVPADLPLLWSLATAQNEGLADLTDKRVQVEQRLDTAEANSTRRWLLRPAPAAIQKSIRRCRC